MDVDRRQLHLRIPMDEYKKLKVKCAYDGISMQDYICRLISGSLGSYIAKGGSILIIEDEKILRDSLRDSLKDTHSVTTAENGEAALELIKKSDFDILIVDVRLPGKSGIDVIRETKLMKPYIRSIVITAFPSVELAVEAMKYGAVDYLVKPIRFEELEGLIWGNLSKVRTQMLAPQVEKSNE
jgi:YesN/AraC family two-component response regulator